MSETPSPPDDGGPDAPDAASRPAPRPVLENDARRADLWARGRTWATATWSIPVFVVLLPAVVVPLVGGGSSVASVLARVAVVLLLLVSSAALLRRRGDGVVRGLALGLLVTTGVLAVAVPLGMLVRAVTS